MSVFVDIRLQGKKTPEKPFRTGQGLGQFADAEECDAVAQAAGVTPLSQFYGYADVGLIDDIADALEDEDADEAKSWAERARSAARQWHDSAAGLQTISALLTHFDAKWKAEPDDEFLEEIVNDLRAFQRILKKAAELNIRFRFEVSA